MVTILNLGSCNRDVVFRVPRLVAPGETLAASTVEHHAGGKGLNQSIALARAGAAVAHLGCVGGDGAALRTLLEAAGVDCRWLETVDTPSGCAFIQIDDAGENAIVLDSGANALATAQRFATAIASASGEDWLLVQNETPQVAEAIALARGHGLRVACNPAPMTAAVRDWPLGDCGLLIVNRGEAAALTGLAVDEAAEALLTAIATRWACAMLVLTDGADGAWLCWAGRLWHETAPAVAVVDTVGAGDTFVGYFLAALTGVEDPPPALRLAVRAAAIAVTRRGAATAIPHLAEVRAALSR